MILLTDWAAAWKMTGMGVGIVFAILVILVLILQIMGFISAHTKSSKPIAGKTFEVRNCKCRKQLQHERGCPLCCRMLCHSGSDYEADSAESKGQNISDL